MHRCINTRKIGISTHLHHITITLHCIMLHCITVQYSTKRDNTLQDKPLHCTTTQCVATQHNTVLTCIHTYPCPESDTQTRNIQTCSKSERPGPATLRKLHSVRVRVVDGRPPDIVQGVTLDVRALPSFRQPTDLRVKQSRHVNLVLHVRKAVASLSSDI
jgi:hypothetical protein